MNWIKKILGLKIEKQCAIHNVVRGYSCLGCAEYHELNELIRFQVIGESAVQNRCGKCLTKIVEGGKMVEIL
jgi:hypothetical protein